MSKVASLAVELSGDFKDSLQVWQDFLYLVGSIKSVTVLAVLKHDFPGGGFSGVVIIGESHVAIHTWPEDDYAWAELATCGDQSALSEFRDKLAEKYRLNSVTSDMHSQLIQLSK